MRAELGAFDRGKVDSTGAMWLIRFAVGLLAIAWLAACGPEPIPNPNKQRDSGATGSGGTDAGRDGGETGAAGGGRGGDDGGRGGAGAGGRAGAGAGAGASAGSDAGSSGSLAGSSGAGSGGGAGTVAGGDPGGSGGSAGCTGDSACAVDRPECKTDGTCGSCTGDAACAGRAGTERCALSGAQGQCVRCVEHADCTDAAAPYCAGNRCVECESHAQCTEPGKPECSAGVCTGCTGDGACEGRAPNTHCVMAAGDALQGQCAACTSDSHCDNPTPECGASHTCVGCTSSESCEGRVGTTVCDQSSEAAFTGKCVQCTGADYASCGSATGGTPYVCDSLARTCTTQLKASALTCEVCVSDAQCAAGRVCMRTKFGAADTGSYCLWTQDAAGPSAPNGNCGAVRPYIIGENAWQSVDGATPTVCKSRVSTCQGQSQFSGASCSGPTPEGHAQCGAEGVEDAYCAPFLTGHVCTVPCVSFQDCQDTRPGDDMECKQQTLGAIDVKVCQFQ